MPAVESWKKKFANNADRMERNFLRGNQRCGFFDENQLPHGGPAPKNEPWMGIEDDLRYDRENPMSGIKQITTGFRKWAERYLSECSGQKTYHYQVNRMTRWNQVLQMKLDGHYKNRF